MAEEIPEYKVIRRRTIRNVNLAGDVFEVYAITFVVPGKAPRTIFIPKEEYSEEKEKEEIIKKIKEELAA